MLGHADLSASSRQVSSSDSSGGAIANLGTAHQRRLLIPLARTVALAFAQNDLVQAMHDVQSQAEADVHDGRELEGMAAAFKVANAAHATVTIQACREVCGGAGYLWDNRLALLNADTDVFTTFEGDNTVLLQLVTKGLLTNSQDSFESMDSRAMVLFGARHFAGAVIERVIGGSVVQRLIAWGHIDRLLLDALARATEECEDAEAKGVLDALCDLFVHATVEATPPGSSSTDGSSRSSPRT